MKKLSLLLVGLLSISFVAYAGAFLTNDTGADAVGLRVTFSEPVTITAFGDTLTAVTPQTLSSEIVFSGGTVGAWGGQWFNYAPATATIVQAEWLLDRATGSVSTAENSNASDSTHASTIDVLDASTIDVLENDSTFGQRPTVPDTARDLVYGYLEKPRECGTYASTQVPIYVSIPIATPIDYVFSAEVDIESEVVLHRVDETDLVGAVTVPQIPATVKLCLFVNGDPVGPSFTVEIENGYQAITLAIQEIPGIESRTPLPPAFHRGACVTDIWGSYLYGAHGEWATVHTRDYFEHTCLRLAEDGVADVYVTSFIEYVTIYPSPQMQLFGEGGAGGISRADLEEMTRIAHEYGLRFHLMYNAYSTQQESLMTYLWRTAKTETWIRTLLDEYQSVIVEEARKAEACGVDYFMLNWQHGAVSYRGHESLWADRWGEIVDAVAQVYTGKLQYNLPMWDDIHDIVTGAVPLSTFDRIDSFLYSQWNPNFDTHSDSLPIVYGEFREMIANLQAFANAVPQPLYLEVAFQSTDGYLVDGWYDVAIGLVGNTRPDFFEQARLYEGLLQAITQSDVVDGIISYKYHWDDPFGPDLDMSALARMDLSASVRNKPAEAVLKRWFGGEASPASNLSEEALAAINRPWCQSIAYEVPYSGPEEPLKNCSFVIDDFQQPGLRSALGGVYDYDSHEKHHPEESTTSLCSIAREEDDSGNAFLAAAYAHNSWLKVRLTGFGEFDASRYEGVQLTLWGDHRLVADLELGTVNPNHEWKAYQLYGLQLSEQPRTFRIPFADLGLQSDGSSDGLFENLESLLEIGIFVEKGDGILFIDDMCVY